MIKDQNLEDKIWYRLLKVLYWIGWILVILIVIATFFTTKPTGKPVATKSTITCPNNESYSWKYSYEGYYDSEDTILDTKDHVNVMGWCGLNKTQLLVKNKYEDTTTLIDPNSFSDYDHELLNNDEQVRLNPPYKIHWVTDYTIEKWMKSVGWSILALFVANIILDSLRNIVMYIVVGRKFSYPFLKLWFNSNNSSS